MKEHLGELYDKTSDFQQEQFDVLSQVVRSAMDVKVPRRLFDIGAGTGARTKQCLTLFPNVAAITAIEPDWDMIAVAERKYADPRIRYVKAKAEDIVRMPLEQENYDFVLSNWSLHWVSDKRSMMSAINARTAPGSYLAFSTCERLPAILTMIDQYVRTEFRVANAESPYFYLDRQGWKDFLASCGWDIVASETRDIPRDVVDARQYLDHWFTASTTKFMYGRHLVEMSPEAHHDLLWMIKRGFPSSTFPNGLAFKEEGYYALARKRG